MIKPELLKKKIKKGQFLFNIYLNIEKSIKISRNFLKNNKKIMETNPNISPIFVGYVTESTFGNSDGVMYLHIAGHDETITEFIVYQGNAPFSVQLKIDGNLVRTISDIPACENYEYMNLDPLIGPICEMNCEITNLPAGFYNIIITDSVGNDCRGMLNIFEVQPPYATLNGTVDPNGLDTTVWFDYGLFTSGITTYDKTAQFGIVNGFDVVNCSLRLKSKSDSGDPIEYLEEGKTYHYRIRASNSYGESFGDDVVFQTLSYLGAPVAITLPATYIS